MRPAIGAIAADLRLLSVNQNAPPRPVSVPQAVATETSSSVLPAARRTVVTIGWLEGSIDPGAVARYASVTRNRVSKRTPPTSKQRIAAKRSRAQILGRPENKNTRLRLATIAINARFSHVIALSIH